MGVKIRGDRTVQANLRAYAENMINRKAPRAIHAALNIGAGQAAIYTPIKTSTLINSQYRDVFTKDGRITGRVGYSADYAMYVHNPAIRPKFTRPTAQKEFLTKGFADVHDRMVAEVKRELGL
ncbi:HK97 gp10 family phage protein [Klebsiella sp. BIGb0407]|uniref:HK97 gp10 family phage protein n=1 Tax=Klebsiella sp. BIGb0407 TaxID=2940603 RepID=UPI00216A81A9|nr:HK97 gp10 family phage protein [Klebsiella sp. BIGb0407]MCS3430031.1 hypothetical protein [Klebsiella sp. BIGb0407]